ncbi:MAG: hypothetical protein K9J18_00590 [Crocinitomicaceae bacterium]|jgi:hypothetical protein|nr:hypothetical protein [Crocinitomicaceae bacterium]
MKTLFIFGLLLLSFQLKAQFKTLELKSGSTYRYTQLHFVSDDTLYFKAKTDKLDYKVAVADLHSKFYLPVGKYYHFNSKSQNLKPLKIAMGVGIGLMLGGAGAAFLLDTDFVALYAIVMATPGAIVFTVSNTFHKLKKTQQNAVLAT